MKNQHKIFPLLTNWDLLVIIKMKALSFCVAKTMQGLSSKHLPVYLFSLLLFVIFVTGCAKRIPLQLENAPHEWQPFFVKNVTTSSESTDSNGPFAVIDSNTVTAWKSQLGEPRSWVCLELPTRDNISSIKIDWGESAGLLYSIQVSQNGSSWDTVSVVDDGTADESRTINFEPVQTKYIKVSCSQCTPDDYCAIKEITLNPSRLLEEIQVSASSFFGDNVPEFAIDGNLATRWDSEHGIDPSWIMIDFGRKINLSKVKIRWERASAREYAIELSDDGIGWRSVAEIRNGKEEETRTISFSTIEGRYLRVFGKKRTTEWGYSIWEIEVFE